MEKDYLLTNEISDEHRVTLIYFRKVIREHKVKALKHGRDYIASQRKNIKKKTSMMYIKLRSC